MDKIEKYNGFADEIKAKDIIVFTNGERKEVIGVKGHIVTFEDEKPRDLYVIEQNIEGIIHWVREKPHQTTPTRKTPTQQKTTDKEWQAFIESIRTEDTLASSYSELRRKIAHGRQWVEFYHMTAIQNALEIFSGDYMYSRERADTKLKYDNIEKNETTRSVMESNYSTRIEKYVRFYLNIKNATTYSFKKNYEQNHSFGVIIALDFDSIITANTNIVLSPQSAHYLEPKQFDWSKYNIAYETNLKNLKASDFDFEKTFSICDFETPNPYLAAEILFYEKIPVNIVSHIYFKEQREMSYFLNKLPYNKRKELERRCMVRKDLFW